VGNPTLEQFISIVGGASASTLLLVFIYGALSGRVIFKREADKDEKHKQELLDAKDDVIEELRKQLAASEKRADHWESMAFRAAQMTGKSLEIATASATGTTPG
jgi:hypothetical protein